jgi:hypothetical protein
MERRDDSGNVIFGGVYKKKIVYSLLVILLMNNTKCDQRDTLSGTYKLKGYNISSYSFGNISFR